MRPESGRPPPASDALGIARDTRTRHGAVVAHHRPVVRNAAPAYFFVYWLWPSGLLTCPVRDELRFVVVLLRVEAVPRVEADERDIFSSFLF